MGLSTLSQCKETHITVATIKLFIGGVFCEDVAWDVRLMGVVGKQRGRNI